MITRNTIEEVLLKIQEKKLTLGSDVSGEEKMNFDGNLRLFLSSHFAIYLIYIEL